MYVFMYRALKTHVPYIIIVFIGKYSFVNIATLIIVYYVGIALFSQSLVTYVLVVGMKYMVLYKDPYNIK